MKFMVSKVSKRIGRPCENAFREKHNYIEIRTINSFVQFDEKFSDVEGKWISKGINHCVNKEGYIQREFKDHLIGWFIEIDSLEELIEFNNKHGKIIIKKCNDNSSINEIEIYDDYRE